MTTTVRPYQLLPDLTPEEYEALRADISANGVRVPIDVDEDGNILDGHHRARIADELGVSYGFRVVAGLDELGKRNHARAVNAVRRQLTREQRRQIVAEMRAEGQTEREISETLGIPKTTVHDDIAASTLSDSSVVDSDQPGQQTNRTPEPPQSTVNACTECGLVLPKPAWHCHGCGSHYEIGIAICTECNPPTNDDADKEPPVPPQPTTTPRTRPGRKSRKPLPDQFFTVAHDLTKIINRLAAIADDDRFPRNAEQIATKHRSDLLRAVDALTDVLNRLSTESTEG